MNGPCAQMLGGGVQGPRPGSLRCPPSPVILCRPSFHRCAHPHISNPDSTPLSLNSGEAPKDGQAVGPGAWTRRGVWLLGTEEALPGAPPWLLPTGSLSPP